MAGAYARAVADEAGAIGERQLFGDPYQLVIFACAGVASLTVHLFGPRFNINVYGYWQVLDPSLLTHHLLDSLWNLQMQPPLYNLAIGLLLQLPTGLRAPIAELAYFFLYAFICMTTYASMMLLSIPRKVALVVVLVLVVLDPAQLFFSKTLFYATPTAAFVTVL